MRPLLAAVALGASLSALAPSAEQSLAEAARNATAGRPAAEEARRAGVPPGWVRP